MSDLLSTPIEYLKGIGPRRGEILRKEAGIFTYRDLINYFPFRYVDRSSYQTVSQIPHHQGAVQLKGTLVSVKEVGGPRNKRLEAKFEDGTGRLDLVWFKGIKWIKPNLKTGTKVKVYGRPKKFGLKINIAHPELEFIGEGKDELLGLQAVYHSGEKLQSLGFDSKGFEKIVKQLLPYAKGHINENLPDWIRSEYNLMEREKAFMAIHAPVNFDEAKKAQIRLKFEELFFLQLELLLRKQISQKKIKGHVLPNVGDYFNELYKNHLPFDLTGAQKRVIKEIRKDMSSGLHMNRLLQGDVGSGKTLVAIFSMLIAIGNGYQACLMAPTEILANQHYKTIKKFLEKLGVRVELLTGSKKQSERKPLHAALEAGEIDILVGTHALLEDKVKYANLGIAVIDEQHRFGVAQRSRLWKKNTLPPHVLVMTATPIPRTLALTFYGDLDVSVIDELPPGRKHIQTSHRQESSRLKVFQFIEDEIKKGRQVYIVYPLIQESEKMDYQNLMDGHDAITRRFPLPDYKVSIVHGKMKPEDKD